MATENTPPVEAPTPAPAAEVTPLPIDNTPAPINVTGTVAEMLSMRKADKPKEVKEEDKAGEKKLDDVDKKLREMLFKGKKKEKAEKSAEEPKQEEAPTPEPPAPKAEEPKPAPAKAPVKKVAVKDRAAELKERELELERQRLELEREKLEIEKSKSKPSPERHNDDLSALSPDERYELEVFQVMAKMDPSKHGDLPKRVMEVASATAKYKTQWEKDHPGEQFDPEDSEHDSFFEKNQVKYDRKDFKRAEHKLATDGETDPKVEQLEKANRELAAKQKIKDLEPVMVNTWANSLDAMIEAINPDIVKVAREGGKDKLLEEYPVEGGEILQAARALEVYAAEAFKILEGEGLFTPEPDKNHAHARILDIIRHQERLIQQQPKDEQLDPDGRSFVTWAQWAELSPQQQENHWHMGAKEVIDVISRDLAGRIRYELDRLEKLAESKNKRNSVKEKPAEIKEKPAEHRSPAASPSSAGRTTVDTSAKAATPADDKLTKIIRSGLFKRSS